MTPAHQRPAGAATVLRDGETRSVPAAEIVCGDIILIEEGGTTPADARVLHSTALQTAEAALTGESLPVSKDIAPIAGDAGISDRHNMIFSGTAATYGPGKAVVTATGMQTEMGRIAGMLDDAPQETTPLLITLMMFQLFNARSNKRSAFCGLFHNPWLWSALGLSLALHVAVIYVPFLQSAFSTTSLSIGVGCAARRSPARCSGCAN